MNSNRSRYTSTPTYGMQKRSFAKKTGPVRPASEAPDFSQAPAPLTGMPFQAQSPVSQPAPIFQQQGIPVYPAQNQPIMPVQPTPPVQNMQMQFAMPSFVQPGNMFPAQQNSMQQPLNQPLGNTVPPIQPTGSFSSHAQGFVPPAMQPAARPVVRQAAPAMQPPFTSPVQQPVQPFGGMPPVMSSTTVQQTYGYPPMAQQNAAFTQPTPQQSGPVRLPREPMDADKLWSIFLFGILPLLFIPCLFVTGIWNFVRFIFIGAAVIGLGVMWYRQMYTPSLRLIISMVYVALCIGAIAMTMQSTSDVRQTNSNMNQQAAVQQQQSQTENTAVALPSEIPSPTETPSPVSGPSEAEKRLGLFMNLWSVNNTTEMVHLVQPSWCSAQENPSMALFMVLANRTPEDFTIEDISGTETDNSRTVTMRATINKNTGKAPSIYRFMIMMVKEGGEWYVNPNSLATNDEQAAATDENVVKTQSVGLATEAPRTTVTPPPPASTSLYYNMGGNSYHMDPNCPSVNADNLPFDVTFSYGELKEVKNANGLVPCLRCGAPTNTLD